MKVKHKSRAVLLLNSFRTIFENKAAKNSVDPRII